jgi:hypothetical protein
MTTFDIIVELKLINDKNRFKLMDEKKDMFSQCFIVLQELSYFLPERKSDMVLK